jgi:hypothetical protein
MVPWMVKVRNAPHEAPDAHPGLRVTSRNEPAQRPRQKIAGIFEMNNAAMAR